MCEPVSAVLAAVTIASTAGQLVAQSKTAKAQEEAILAQRGVVREENRRQATNELFDQMREMRRQQGRIRTSAGEAGLSLNSGVVEGLLLDTAVQMELNGDRTLANLESRNTAAETQADSMMSRVQRPTALGAGLQLGAATASGFSTIQRARITRSQGVAPQGGS